MSAHEYHQISQQEFEEAIGFRGGELVSGLAFFPIKQPGCKELLYEAIIDDKYSIRIYSSIILNQGSRDVGQDAIRVVKMFFTPEGKFRPVGKEKRVNRIGTWRKNLLLRIDAVASEQTIGCPECGGPMKERRGPHGAFWGCLGYPKCCGTRKAER